MMLTNNERARITLLAYATRSMTAWMEWAAVKNREELLEELEQFNWCSEECKLDYFYADLRRYIGDEESSRCEEMNLLYRQYRDGLIHEDDWYESIWASELPQTYNYIWEEEGVSV